MNDVKITIRDFEDSDRDVCMRILDRLQEWFGIAQSRGARIEE